MSPAPRNAIMSEGNSSARETLRITAGICCVEMRGITGREINQPAVDRRANAPQRSRGCRYLERRELHEPHILLRGGVCCLDTEAQRRRESRRGGAEHRDTRREMHFSVGSVSGLCGGRHVRATARRAKTTRENTRSPCIHLLVFCVLLSRGAGRNAASDVTTARASVLSISSCLRALRAFVVTSVRGWRGW